MSNPNPKTPYLLFIDDERTLNQVDQSSWPTEFLENAQDRILIARNTYQAMEVIRENGLPFFFSFDHDLGIDPSGNEDTVMIFLKRFYREFGDQILSADSFPGYSVHSANPVGKKNIISYIESWKKSLG